MGKYILIRLLNLFPSLVIITLALFFMSKSGSSDPVDMLLGLNSSAIEFSDVSSYQFKYKQTSKMLGLDKPLFYFSISPKSFPDTLWTIENLSERRTFKNLIFNFRNQDHINQYLSTRDQFIKEASAVFMTKTAQIKVKGFADLKKLKEASNQLDITTTIALFDAMAEGSSIEIQLQNLSDDFEMMSLNPSPFRMFPKFRWFGTDNQYHQWIKQLLSGHFGVSIRDGRPVKMKILEAMNWSISINGIAILLSLFFSIILGSYLGAIASPRVDRFISTLTYIVFAIPLFWLATMLVVFFTTPEYGKWTDLFPGIGIVQSFEGGSFISRFLQSYSRLVLPILCLVLAMMAYLTRQMRSSVKNELSKPYLKILKSKGIRKGVRLRKHLLPNALFPMITLLGSLIPFAFSGSLVIEYIFNIPGMGRLLMDSILFQDWNVVFTIVLIIAMITILGLLIADIIYAWLDPRVRLS